MIQCDTCGTARTSGHAWCPACGAPRAVGAVEQAGARGRGANDAHNQPGTHQRRHGANGPAGHRQAKQQAAAPPSESADTDTETWEAALPADSAGAGAPPLLPSNARPRERNRIMLGPASDPELAASDLTGHTVSSFDPVAPKVVVVPPSNDRRGLTIAATVCSAVLLIVLVAIVVVVMRAPSGTNQPPTTLAAQKPTEPTPVPTSTTPASVAIHVASASVTSGDAATIVVDFSGDPSQVKSSTLIMNGIPTSESSGGLRNQFTFPTTFPGSLDLKVSIAMTDGRTVESGAVTLTVVARAGAAPASPSAPGGGSSAGGSSGGVALDRWVSMLGQFRSEDNARGLAARFPGSTVLSPGTIPSLGSPYWVVFTGNFSSGEEAVANCRALGRVSRDDCFAAYVSNNPGDVTKRLYP